MECKPTQIAANNCSLLGWLHAIVIYKSFSICPAISWGSLFVYVCLSQYDMLHVCVRISEHKELWPDARYDMQPFFFQVLREVFLEISLL